MRLRFRFECGVVLRAEIIAGPDPEGILSRYRISDLVTLVKKKFNVKYSHSGIHALMKKLKLSHVKPRPQHPKNNPIIMEVWTEKGMRPTHIRQNGFKSAYFIGAVNPNTEDKYSLIYDGMDFRVINQFLKNFSKKVTPEAHAIMLVDGEGWHVAEDLIVPSNVTLYLLPPYSPELHPIEQIWGYLKSNFLSGRVFKDMTEIFTYGVRAWRELTDEIIKSVCASGLKISTTN